MLALLTLLFLSSAAPPSPQNTGLLFQQYRLLYRDQLGTRCIFQPSCSHYAEEALAGLGFIRGLFVAIERWTRCHSIVSFTEREILPDGRISDPLFREGGVICWGRYLLPF